MTQVDVNGNSYSDDGSLTKDMTGGGHRTNLLPMISDLMTEINALKGQGATSPTTATVVTGTVTLILHQSSSGIQLGSMVKAYSWASSGKAMIGEVIAAPGASTTLTINSRFTMGSGVVSDWVIVPALMQTTPRPVKQITGAYTVLAGDSGSILDITASAFTVTLPNPATVGKGFTLGIRNSGGSAVVLTPAGSTLIDTVSSLVVNRGQVIEIFGDGSALKSLAVGGTHYSMASYAPSLGDTVVVAASGGGGGKVSLHDVLGAGPVHPGYRSGAYYYSPQASVANNSMSIQPNRAYAVPFFQGRGTDWNRIGLAVWESAPASNFRLGIYGWDLDTAQPGSLVVDGGIASTFADGKGDRELTISTYLSTGWFALVVLSDGTATVHRADVNQWNGWMMGTDVNTSALVDMVMYASMTYGALASTFPATVIATAANSFPAIHLRKV